MKSNAYGYFSRDVLEFLGNLRPTQEQIFFVEKFLHTHSVMINKNISTALTPREKACLLLAAYGNSTDEISVILKIKPTTVCTYRKEILRKLDCKNMAHAVFSGIHAGRLWC